jgi:SAM-dependent methyltransferase
MRALLTLSDLAAEGMANGGSFRFADHLYKAEPSGRFLVGYWLDSVFMRLPAAVAFRRRYLHARDGVSVAIRSRPRGSTVRLLTIPCGIPRDIVEAADLVHRENAALLDGVEYVGMDIDPAALDVARRFSAGSPLRTLTFHQGNALKREEYPAGRFHFVSSTGLTEFLDDRDVRTLFANVYDALEPGGTFYTSASASDPVSIRLLEIVNLLARYRSQSEIAALVESLPWHSVSYVADSTGLQTFVTATK